jgi:aminoglycoside/choline kinase family phosphotransferase
LTGDVSPRRYVRLERTGGATAIVSYYPPGARDTGERFRQTTTLLSTAGVRVPKVLDWDVTAGMMLLEDVGRRSVYDAVAGGEPADRYRRQALAVLESIAVLDAVEVEAINPRLDGTVLRRELQQSWELVLAPRGLVGDQVLAAELRLALFELSDRLEAATARPCHRDFMARNLLIDREDRIVVIDHQDLRLGPPWYDLASLLNDSVYASPDEEERLLNLSKVPRPEREAYHRAAAQRALKIVGTFAAFADRGFDRHLTLVEPSLQAARRHLERLPETAPLMRDLRKPWDDVGALG